MIPADDANNWQTNTACTVGLPDCLWDPEDVQQQAYYYDFRAAEMDD